MKKIALISDNHSYIGEDVLKHLRNKDEVWHAGDIGSMESIQPIIHMVPKFRAVYGNIDTGKVKEKFSLNEIFDIDGLKVLMTHIGGYPSRYKKRAIKLIHTHHPDLYICGHSHILKVMRDHQNHLIHMNPGAYGHTGFHRIRTLLTFDIDEGKIKNLQAIELGRRGILSEEE